MLVIAATVASFGAGCGDNGAATNTGGPNPLGYGENMLPWPSMLYTRTDSSSPTGIRLALPPALMPKNIDDIEVDPTAWNRWDGFSLLGPALIAFPNGVSSQGLPPHHNPQASLAADAPIILMNLETGARVPFFAEVDQNIKVVTARNLIIRPLARLAPGARHVVAIRKSVKAADGGDLPITEGFAALRDGTPSDNPQVEQLRPRYVDIFAKLEAAGVAKSDLVVAWDYVTASDAFIQSDLTLMRDVAFGMMGANAANLSFTANELAAGGSHKRYAGTFTSPNFLTAGEKDVSVMRRDADNKPAVMGLRDANFAALVPKCVTSQPLPRPTIVFGHGIFGNGKDYLDNEFVASLAEQHCFVILAGDFIGLTSRQIALVPSVMNEFTKSPQLAEKLAQSLIDFMSLSALARGPMATSSQFMVGGKAVIDVNRIFYLGGSLGGIMGNALMAYDPNLTTAIQAVPGGNWSLLFERSAAWPVLQGAAFGAYREPADYQLLVALLGMAMEPYDPASTAAHLIKNPLPGVPVKRILMWETLGDSLVGNMTTEMVAREIGLDVIAPSVKTPWGMTAKTGELQNAMYILDEKPTPLPNDTNVPPAEDNSTHSDVNRRPALLRLIAQYFLEGKISATCKLNGQPAPCDCTTGACN